MCAKMAFQHQAGTAMECLSIPITLQKEPGLDSEGREVLKCGFKIGGGIDQDYRKSPQGYTDNCIQNDDVDEEMEEKYTITDEIEETNENTVEGVDGCDEIQEIVVFIEEFNHENNALVKEDASVNKFLAEDCCKLKCNSKITKDEFLKYRRESQELDYNEQGVNQLDTIMLGILRVISRGSGEYIQGRSINAITHVERKRLRPNFLLGGLPVCKSVFLFAHALTTKRFKRLLKNFKEGGLHLKTHGNFGRLSSRKLSVETVQKAVAFIRQYADHNTKITGNHKGKRRCVKVLSHTETKCNVYRQYKEKCREENDETPLSVRTFLRIWNQCCPDIVIQRAPTKYERCYKCNHPSASDSDK